MVFGVYAIVWMICLAYAAGTARGFYGDGSFFTLRVLQQPGHFFDYDTQRSFASYITQAPLLFGQRLKVETVAVYGVLFHVGNFVVPAIMFMASLYLSRWQPLLFALNAFAIAVYGFGTNFINTEANLFFAFVVLSATILALPGPQPLLRSVMLPMLSFALLRIYEGMVLAGPVLAVWCILLYGNPADERERPGLLIAALLFTLGCVIGVGGLLAPRDPTNVFSFLATVFYYVSSPQALVLLSAGTAVFAVIATPNRYRPAFIALSIAFGIWHLWRVFHIDGYYSYSVYYTNRPFLVLLTPVFASTLLLLSRFRPGLLTGGTAATGFLVVPFLMAATGDLLGTYRWHDYVSGFCDVLKNQSVPGSGFEQLKEKRYQTGWGWTHPTLSLLLRPRSSRAMVHNDSFQTWQPFDPESQQPLPYYGLCEMPLLGAVGAVAGVTR